MSPPGALLWQQVASSDGAALSILRVCGRKRRVRRSRKTRAGGGAAEEEVFPDHTHTHNQHQAESCGPHRPATDPVQTRYRPVSSGPNTSTTEPTDPPGWRAAADGDPRAAENNRSRVH